MNIVSSKSKVMALQNNNNIRSKILIEDNSTEHINQFKYLGYSVSHIILMS